MSYFFVSSGDGNDAEAGTDMDLAWALFEKAHESGGLSAGDWVIVRRTHSEIPVSDIAPIYDGTAKNPLKSVGWPRAAIPNTTITEADFTNGSRLIDNVVTSGDAPDREKHTARYITAPDGEQYMITVVLWEAGFDGIGAGDAFAVGDILTNTTQTKKGKVWACSATEGTDTLQYVRDSATAWVNNDNVTSNGGGNGEIDAGGETAVGFLIDREYAGGTVSGVDGKFQIEEDDDYDFLNYSVTFTAANATEIFTITSGTHPYATGDCCRVVSDDTLPTGLSADTDYYVIYLTTTTFQLATTLANANAGTNLAITDDGTGNHTVATIEDSTWTIKKTNYNADADDVPLIDFNDGAFQLTFTSDLCNIVANMEFKDSSDSGGIVKCYISQDFAMIGCLLKQTASNSALFEIGTGSSGLAKRGIIEGSGSGVSQVGLRCDRAAGRIKDIAIFNCGDLGCRGMYGPDSMYENVNIGVEMANGDYEIETTYGIQIIGKDIQLGGTNGTVRFSVPVSRTRVKIENYQKQLGDNATWFPGGIILSVTAGAGDPVPNQRGGGATTLLEITPNVANYEYIDDWAVAHWLWTVKTTTANKSYRIYIQNAMELNLKEADDVWFTLKYVSGYDDASEYVYETKTSVSSNNPIPVRADLDDWGEYIEITGVTPAVASNLFIELFWSKYDAANKCYLDPQLVIS